MFRKKAPELPQRQRYVRAQEKPQPFSYRSLRSDTKTSLGRHQSLSLPKARSGKLVSWTHFLGQRAGFVIGAVALLVCLVELLMLSADVKIMTVDAGSQAYLLHSPSAYAEAADKLFAASLTNKNKITVNTDEISKKLQAEFPELGSVSITLPLIGHRPIVYLEADKPALILVEGGERLLLNQKGQVEARAERVPSAALRGLPVVTDHSDLPSPTVGATALSAGEVSFIQAVLYEMQYGGVQVGALSLPAATQELDVAIQGQPFFVKFNMQSNDARQQAGTFLATWQYLQQQHVTPGAYIDVRVDGQAYYK